MSTIAQNTKEWLIWRKQGLGSSDVPIIMGKSPYKTIQELYIEKTSDEVKDESNFITDLGHKFEYTARAQFELLDMDSYQPETIESKEYPFLRVSLDGVNWDQKKILEIKMVGKDVIEKAKTYNICPEHHYIQMQYQMLVSGLKKCQYFCYTLKKDRTELDEYHTFEIQYDEEISKQILSKVFWFWNCVQTKTPPFEIDETVGEKYAKIKTQIDELNEELNLLKEVLINMCDQNKYQVGPVRVTKSTRKGSVNYSKIPELENVDLDQYRGPDATTTRIDLL